MSPATPPADQPEASPTPAGTISACIVCRNEADRLEPCLESVTWADEIVVMDLDSADGSVALAETYGARVLRRAPVPIVELVRNEVAAAAKGDWILVVDPDERVTPGLANELRHLACRDDLDAIVIPRMNFDLGFPPSHPMQRYEPQLRMYRRDRVAWPIVPNRLPDVSPDRRHEIPRRDELVLVHDRSRNIPEVLERSLRYAPRQAQAMLDEGQTFTAPAMLAALASKAYRHGIRSRPWRDGVPGLLRAGILIGFHFYVWAAFWQISGRGRAPDDDRLIRQLGVPFDFFRILLRLLGMPARLFSRLRNARKNRPRTISGE